MDEETLLVLSIGLCLGMVVIATQVGFSAELGAFIMGSIIAETTSAERVEHLMKPVKDLFGAVFFVSVGMLIDPKAIIEYGGPVLAVTFLTLFGKLFSTTAGALLSGQPLKQSVQVGMSMAQIGEFAFIVATLGLSLGVISDFLFPVAVGASAITTFTTPYMIRYSGKAYDLLVKILPERWVKTLNAYSTSTHNIQADSDWKAVIKAYVNIGITNGIVLLALSLLSINFLVPFLTRNIENNTLAALIALVISLAAAAPFFWAFMAKKPENMAYKELWLNKTYNHGPLVVIEIVRIVLGALIIGFWVDRLFSTTAAIIVVVPIFIIILVIFSKRIQRFYQRIEGRFLYNLNARDIAAEEKTKTDNEAAQSDFAPQADLSPWDAHMINLQVPQHAVYAGKMLVDLAWREQYGINIAYIKRGDILIYAPGRHNMLLPFDNVGIIATDDQMQEFTKMFDATKDDEAADHNLSDIILQKVTVNEHTKLRGKTIRDSNIREQTNGLVVGIERNKLRILNPDSNTVFEWGDIVWIVGERKKIQKLGGV